MLPHIFAILSLLILAVIGGFVVRKALLVGGQLRANASENFYNRRSQAELRAELGQVIDKVTSQMAEVKQKSDAIREAIETLLENQSLRDTYAKLTENQISYDRIRQLAEHTKLDPAVRKYLLADVEKKHIESWMGSFFHDYLYAITKAYNIRENAEDISLSLSRHKYKFLINTKGRSGNVIVGLAKAK